MLKRLAGTFECPACDSVGLYPKSRSCLSPCGGTMSTMASLCPSLSISGVSFLVIVGCVVCSFCAFPGRSFGFRFIGMSQSDSTFIIYTQCTCLLQQMKINSYWHANKYSPVLNLRDRSSSQRPLIYLERILNRHVRLHPFLKKKYTNITSYRPEYSRYALSLSDMH